MLQNLVEQAVIYARGKELRFSFTERYKSPSSSLRETVPQERANEILSLKDLSVLEETIIRRELERSRWKVYGAGGAAEALGLKATTLYSKKHQLQKKLEQHQ